MYMSAPAGPSPSCTPSQPAPVRLSCSCLTGSDAHRHVQPSQRNWSPVILFLQPELPSASLRCTSPLPPSLSPKYSHEAVFVHADEKFHSTPISLIPLSWLKSSHTPFFLHIDIRSFTTTVRVLGAEHAPKRNMGGDFFLMEIKVLCCDFSVAEKKKKQDIQGHTSFTQKSPKQTKKHSSSFWCQQNTTTGNTKHLCPELLPRVPTWTLLRL